MCQNKRIRNILCVHQGYELYGSDRSFLLSVQAFNKKYPEATITIVVPESGPLIPYLEPLSDNIIIRDLAILRKNKIKENPLFFIWALVPKTIHAYRELFKYDLIYINTIVVLDYIFASWFSNKKIIIHVREISTGISRILFSIFLKFSRAHLLFNSDCTKKSYSFKSKKKSFVIYNAVEGFCSLASLKPSGSRLKILHIGRFNAWKGQELLLKSINSLSPAIQEQLNVRIVGSHFKNQVCFTENIIELIQEFGLEKSVEIHPFDNFPVHHFEWADVVVVSSTRPEPFGRVAIEAMSAGRCVVAANHGGLPEIITDLKDGLLFQPNSNKDLKKKIEMLVHDRSLAVVLGGEGKKRFHNSFTQEIFIRNFSEYLSFYLRANENTQ